MLFTSDSEGEVELTVRKASTALKDGGFDLREIASSSKKVMSTLPPLTVHPNSSNVKVLGIHFDCGTDEINLALPQVNTNASTKREIVSTISSLFDPLGFLAPLTLNMKLLIREMCINHPTWDENLPTELLSKWKKLADNFNRLPLNTLTLPRFTVSLSQPFNVYVFSDASKEAYGFVVFLEQNGRGSFFYSKCRLAPKNIATTLPKLEFLALYQAILYVHNLLSSVHFENCKVSTVSFLADSQISLSWVLSDKTLKNNLFVSNRLPECKTVLKYLQIRSDTKLHYIPTAYNCADYVTKPFKLTNFPNFVESFLCCPAFLLQSPDKWPKGNLLSVPAKFVAGDTLISATTVHVMDNNLINLSKFSNIQRLLNATAYVFYFIRKVRKNCVDFVQCKKLAFQFLVKRSQSAHFPNEIAYLTNSTKLSELPPLCRNLQLFLDDYGILRSRGRLQESPHFSYDAVNPVVLAGKSQLAKLYIWQAHVSCKHLGTNTCLSYLRSGGFWLTEARRNVSKVLKSCVKCKKFNLNPPKSPTGARLPHYRSNLISPFDTIGIDFTGHIFTRDQADEAHKVYILIFSCLTTRAIHLEVVLSMEVYDFILAFCRFVNIHGVPSVVMSDNALTFKKGGELLSKVLQHDLVNQKFRELNISFRFIPTLSPMQGSLWERLIGVVKKCLYKTIGRKILNYSELLTMISDIKLAVNNRPLYYRSNENDLELLCPNHFISVKPSFPQLVLSPDVVDEAWTRNRNSSILQDILSSLDEREVALDKFTNEFYHSYLLSLREVGNRESVTKIPQVKIGEVCLYKNPTKSRVHWNLVRIVEVFPAHDGTVRNVGILKSDGSTVKTSIYNLIPLELGVWWDTKSDVEDEPASPDTDTSSQDPRRPQRQAAEDAERRNKFLAQRGLV